MEWGQYCAHDDGIGRDLITYVYAPYSAVMEREQDRGLLYRQMRRNPKEFEKMLVTETERITCSINAALSVRDSVISIADPYANPEIIGEKNAAAFAEKYLYLLLCSINKKSGGIIHLCPRSSVSMEKHGFLKCKAHYMEKQDYISFLCGVSGNIFGHLCIHTKQADNYYTLHMTDGIL